MSRTRSLGVLIFAAPVGCAAAQFVPSGGHREGRHRATAKSGAGRRGALALACLSLLALAGLFTAASAMGGQTHPFQSEFTGSDTPAGSLGPRPTSSRSASPPGTST